MNFFFSLVEERDAKFGVKRFWRFWRWEMNDEEIEKGDEKELYYL